MRTYHSSPRALLWLAMLLAGTQTVYAQRVQFPSVVSSPGGVPATAAPVYTAPPPPTIYSQPGTTFAQPGTTFAQPGMTYGTPPAVSLDGSIQPVNPAWDPYAAQQAAPPPLYPQQGFIQPNGTMALGEPQRLIQDIRFEYAFLNGNGVSELGIDDLALSGALAIPFLYNAAPLLIRPGFAVHYWDGPVSQGPGTPDMPPRTYDAFIEAGWKPVVTQWLSGDLRMSVGYYSDWSKYQSEAIRIRGSGLAIFTLSSQFAIVAGIDYINRLQIKLLPAGGVIWTPSPDMRWEILFPNPKLANRITTWGNTDVWLYVGGEYGGGTWAIQRQDLSETSVDYNDLRVFIGTEFLGHTGMKGWFEVGFVWNRELVYLDGTPDFKPNETVMLRAGVSY
ncbi:MAG: hypothetical protein KF708_04730 [Pirellulales bacterium]|nr:hypothetical protein [Pirellulales bacterium]